MTSLVRFLISYDSPSFLIERTLSYLSLSQAKKDRGLIKTICVCPEGKGHPFERAQSFIFQLSVFGPLWSHLFLSRRTPNISAVKVFSVFEFHENYKEKKDANILIFMATFCINGTASCADGLCARHAIGRERLRDTHIECPCARLELRQSLNNNIITIALVFKRVSIYKAKRVNK